MASYKPSTKHATMETPTNTTVTIEVKKSFHREPKGTRYYTHDNQCACCGRFICWETSTFVNLVSSPGVRWDSAQRGRVKEAGLAVFAPIGDVIHRDPAEWATPVGRHCAKQLPATHRVSRERAVAAFSKALNAEEAVR